LAKKLFLVSDLHMGGDGRLQHCDYTNEFIGFLKKLEGEGADTELLVVGDTFGFWETTLVHGAEKLNHISDFRSVQGYWGAYQGDHDGRQSRLRFGL
jgi:UDP-2,3-diacylglucosamine pyrophosphatase LpxH